MNIHFYKKKMLIYHLDIFQMPDKHTVTLLN